MKNIIAIFLIFFSFITCKAQNDSKELNLTGNWILTDYWNNNSDFILTEDNFVLMTINGEVLDGKKFIIKGGKNNGEIAELKYSIDYTKKPIEIDFVAYKDKQEKGRILGAIKMIRENEFLMTLSFDGKRNLNFSKENEEKIMIARRKK